MGIHNLNKFLRNNCPEVFEEIHISQYSFKKVAIDISLYLCKFKTICGDKWVSAFLNLVACLRRNEVHCIFIYDTGSPPEKEQEKKNRIAQRAKNAERIQKLEDLLKKFHLTGEMDSALVELYHKKIKRPQRLLHPNTTPCKGVDISYLTSIIEKMRHQILNISSEDFEMTKKLFDILQIPYYNAPLEAETTCSDLCKRGFVDAVLSEDTDVLAYASPIFLSKINTSLGTCVRINYEKLLSCLDIRSEQFLDLCIMCGTDYNKNIFRVGPEKSFKYLKRLSSIEGIEKEGKLNTDILNYKRGRELFRKYKKVNIKIPYCGRPDIKLLESFLKEQKIDNIEYSLRMIKEAFTSSSSIIFED